MATATDGTTNVSYTYDSDGIRTSKTVNGVKHTYVYASGKLLRETFGDTTIDFFYSTSGQPYALKHNGTTYYYITNLQGDVMQVVNGDGEVVASYQYDPYGNIISATGALAEVNPLRYRGYIYDPETHLYYLQSRYYDPSIGRFLNADSYASTGQGILGNNMFAYCNNNPCNKADNSGHCSYFLFWKIDDCGNATCPDSDSYKDTSGDTPGTTMGYTINGQENLPYADKAIGFGSYGKSGCGLIAVYNAMQLIGHTVSLQDVVNDLYGWMLANGAGGLNPLGLNYYFTSHDISFTPLYSQSSLEKNVEEGSVFVFVVMNNKDDLSEGFHTMAGQYVNGVYRIYNRYNDSKSYMPYTSFEKGFEQEVFIYGVLLE